MAQECVRRQHLGDTNGTPPAYVVVVADFYLSSLTLMQIGESQEYLNLLLISLKQRLEVFPIALPDEAPESTLKVGPYERDSFLLTLQAPPFLLMLPIPLARLD